MTGNLCSGASVPAAGSGAKSVVAGAVPALGAPPGLSRLGSATVTEDEGGGWRSVPEAGCTCAAGNGVAAREGALDAVRVGR